MRRRNPWPWLLVVLAGGAALTGWLRGEAQKVNDPAIAAWVKRLGSEDFSERQAASRELEIIGERALPQLGEAAEQSPDLEIRRRAIELLHRIRFVSRTSGMEFIAVPAGEFEMGSPSTEAGRGKDEDRHHVQVSKFRLGKFEVTQQQFAVAMKRNPSSFAPQGELRARVEDRVTKDFPVEGVTWFDAVEFCNRLSELDGLKPYYSLTNLKQEKEKLISADVTIRGGSGYRLPTEAEWEYACRAGSDAPFHFGQANTGREANVKPAMVGGGYGGVAPKFTNLQRTVAAGSYPPNAWGLSEMHGNVAEWCWDRYASDYYKHSPAADPWGADEGPHRVVRGGSWMVPEESCRSASRFFQTPDEHKPFVGFRVARSN